MKKLFFSALVGFTTCASTTFGQGVVQFNNYVSTTYQQVKYNPAMGGPLAGQPVTSSTVELQLFWALGSFADTTSFSAAANAGVTTFINPGFSFNGGGYYGGPNQILTGWTAGQTVTFQVRGWETSGSSGSPNYFASGIQGISALWQEVGAANANANGIQPSSNPAKGFNVGPPAMTLAAVPEPSVLALSGLGAAALMAFRRKK
jgi:hypothetical protein